MSKQDQKGFISIINTINPDYMSRRDKLLEEFLKEKEEKENKKLGKKRLVSVMSVHRFFGSEHEPFYKELLSWAYKKGVNAEKSRDTNNGK